MPAQKGKDHWRYRLKQKQLNDVVAPEAQEGIMTSDIPLTDHKDIMKRHTVGIMSAVEAMYGAVLIPKCKICFDAHGWLTKCICKEKLNDTQ